jgi:hypothetical protein
MLAAALGGASFSFACLQRELVEVPPAVQSGVSIRIEQSTSDQVDLLVMVDNSNSMREEQTNLTANMPTLIDQLTTPPDDDGVPGPDWQPVSSLHLGVISSDMGTSGYPVTTCDNADTGDDGVLQNLPSASVTDCDATYPKFLTFEVDSPDLNIGHDFECIATLGTGGCGFEQQLFAVEKALTVHAQAGAVNDGFLRNEAILAIIVVTDEEDCSVSDPAIFGDDDSLGPLNLRCYNNPEMVRPYESFVDSILAIKPQHPERIVVAAITGVPSDLVQLTDAQLTSDDIMTTADFEDILNDSRMVETVDYTTEGGGNRLVPSCDVPGLGIAFPPRRIVSWIKDIDAVGNNGLVQSICQADWTDTTRAITRLIASKVRGACLARPLVGPNGVPLADGEHADCIVRETLTDNGSCGPGAFEVGTDGGKTVCQVCQAGDGTDPYTVDSLGNNLTPCAGSSAYWQYTTTDENCSGAGKVEFNEAAEPPDGAIIDLECLSEVTAEG